MSEKLLDETRQDNTLLTKKFGYRIIEFLIIGSNLFMFIYFIYSLQAAQLLFTPFFLFVLILFAVIWLPFTLFSDWNHAINEATVVERQAAIKNMSDRTIMPCMAAAVFLADSQLDLVFPYHQWRSSMAAT